MAYAFSMFMDRKDAARQLLPELVQYQGQPDTVLLAIPRGGLELGEVLRDGLGLPLDIVVTKKIGAPENQEFAIGVVDPTGEVICDRLMLNAYEIPWRYVKAEAKRLRQMIHSRYQDYRGTATPPEMQGKTCIVLDDGIATGHTVEAAVRYLRGQRAARIVLAVPVAAPDSLARLTPLVDQVVCLQQPEFFHAVGQFYQTFHQVSDAEAIRILRQGGSANGGISGSDKNH